jgi:uncharacterized repeat protein (TIGR01451 family)
MKAPRHHHRVLFILIGVLVIVGAYSAIASATELPSLPDIADSMSPSPSPAADPPAPPDPTPTHAEDQTPPDSGDTTPPESTETTPPETQGSPSPSPSPSESPAAPMPEVTSDQADYPPGATVTLSGAKWQPDAVVNVRVDTVDATVTEETGEAWFRTYAPTAAADGTWQVQFDLPTAWVAQYKVVAVGPDANGVQQTIEYRFTDSAGSYTVKWYAADPAVNRAPYLPTYPKRLPSQQAPVWGRAADPLPNAVAYGPTYSPSNLDAVTSLMPKDMALGQIVPFEIEISVSGSTTPENGVITFTGQWSTHTKPGDNFGYDPAYRVYGAFVDSADPGSSDGGAPAFASLDSTQLINPGTSNEAFQGKVRVSGLDNGDRVIVEVWVVLKSTIPPGVGGNVESQLVTADTADGKNITKASQAVNMLQVGTFFTAQADVSVTKSDSPDPVVAGSELTYSLTATNNSADTVANGVTVTDTLDGLATYISSTPCQGSVAATGGVLTWTVGALAQGQSATLTVKVSVAQSFVDYDTSTNPEAGGAGSAAKGAGPPARDMVNNVSVTAITADPTTGNNSYYQPTNILAQKADLAITKTDDADPVFGGDKITYSLKVENLSTTTAKNVVVTDTIDPKTTFVADSVKVDGTTQAYTFDPTTRVLTVNLGDLAGAASKTITFQVTANDEPPYSDEADDTVNGRHNVAVVSSDTGDSNTANNTSDEYTAVKPGGAGRGVIDITKTADPTSVPETGGEVTYTIKLENAGPYLPLTVTSLSDDKFGSLLTIAEDAWVAAGYTKPIVLAPTGSTGGVTSFEFTFEQDLAGEATTAHVNTATVVATDGFSTDITDKDDATLTFTNVDPAISVTKTAGDNEVPETGQKVTFTYRITNTGPEDVTVTSLVDDKFGDLLSSAEGQNGGQPIVIKATDPDSFFEFTVERTLSSDTLTAHTNKIDVVAKDNEGTEAKASDTATVTFTDVPPAIMVTKVVDDDQVPETGQEVTFTYTITNTGPEDVTVSSILDTKLGDLLGTAKAQNGNADIVIPATDPDSSYSFKVTTTLSSDSLSQHVNRVDVVAKDEEGTEATGYDIETVTFTDVPPDISVTKTPNPASVPETGGNVTFTYTVTNNSAEAVEITSLTDDKFGTLAGDADCIVGTTLAAGASAGFEATFAVPAGDYPGSHVNTFTAIGADNDGNSDTASAAATVTYTDVRPDISVAKTADPTSVPETGGNVTFTYTVTNNGAEAVTIRSLVDDRFGPLAGDADCKVGTVLAAGATADFQATFAVPAGDYPGVHVNVFTAMATDDDGNPAVATDDAAVTYTDVLPDISVTKTANPTSVPETGGDVTFTYTVKNNSAEAVTISSLVDDRFGTLAGDADCKVGTTLAGGASASFEATFSVPAGDYPGSHVDVFTAAGVDDDGNTDTATDDATVSYTDVLPDISVTKTANPTSVPETGGDVTFTYSIKNNGPEAVTIASLDDSVYGTLAGDADCKVGTTLPSGASAEFAVTQLVKGDFTGPNHVNVFTAAATDDDGNSDSASDDATVTFTDVAPKIRITKTADPTSVPETGGNVTFTFLVENIGEEDVTLTTSSATSTARARSTCRRPSWSAAATPVATPSS